MEKNNNYFITIIQNIFKLASLSAYAYLMIFSDYYKFISNYDETYIRLFLSLAALVTIISVFKEDLFKNKKLALAYNSIVGATFASLSYKVLLLEKYKVDIVSLGPWIKLRRLWTPREYVDMFFELIKDNPKIDATKISAKFIDQVSKASSVGDLERFKQILIEQQASASQVPQLDATIFQYLVIAIGTLAALYIGYHVVNSMFNPEVVNSRMVSAKLARADETINAVREETIRAVSALEDENIRVIRDINGKIEGLRLSIEKTQIGNNMVVEELKTLTKETASQIAPLLRCSNAINVMVHAFALDGLESGNPELINKALDSLKNYFTVSLKIVNEHIAKARLIADSK